MSKALWKRCVGGLCGALLAVGMAAGAARAEVTTDLSGTVVVWPKVLWDGDRDTVIQLTNTSNNLVHAWCFYVNAELRNPNLQPGPNNRPIWQVTDFFLWLTKQQPFHWVASQGRGVVPGDGFGNDGSGLDAGAVPPVPRGFTGELRCVQVDASGVPMAGNALKGEAVLRAEDGDVSKYNAVSILATAGVSDDQEIRLDNNPGGNDAEGDGTEANSCYATVLVDHFADGATDPILEAGEACGGGCPIRTSLTLVPCSADFENVIGGEVTVQFAITNEFESNFSASTTVECWADIQLGFVNSLTGRCTQDNTISCNEDSDCAPAGFCETQGPFSEAVLGTLSAFTRVTPVDLDGGVIGIGEELHQNLSTRSYAAWDLHGEGTFVNGRWQPRTRYDATLGVPGGPVVDTIVVTQPF